jgi:hypothetical protein
MFGAVLRAGEEGALPCAFWFFMASSIARVDASPRSTFWTWAPVLLVSLQPASDAATRRKTRGADASRDATDRLLMESLS